MQILANLKSDLKLSVGLFQFSILRCAETSQPQEHSSKKHQVSILYLRCHDDEVWRGAVEAVLEFQFSI